MRNQNRYHEKLELPWGQARFLIGTVPGMNSIFWSSTFWWSITLYPSAPPLAGLVHTHQCLRQSPELHRRSFVSALNSDPGSCGRRLPFTDSRTVMISEKEVEQAAGRDSLLNRHCKISYRWWAQTYSSQFRACSTCLSLKGRASYLEHLKALDRSWTNTKYLLLQYKCILKSHTADLSCWVEVSKTSGPVQSLWNNNKAILIGFH